MQCSHGGYRGIGPPRRVEWFGVGGVGRMSGAARGEADVARETLIRLRPIGYLAVQSFALATLSDSEP